MHSKPPAPAAIGCRLQLQPWAVSCVQRPQDVNVHALSHHLIPPLRGLLLKPCLYISRPNTSANACTSACSKHLLLRFQQSAADVLACGPISRLPFCPSFLTSVTCLAYRRGRNHQLPRNAHIARPWNRTYDISTIAGLDAWHVARKGTHRPP